MRIAEEQRIGGYAVAAQQTGKIGAVYESIREFVNAEAHDNIALVDSATTAWVRAFYSCRLQAEDVILVSGNHID